MLKLTALVYQTAFTVMDVDRTQTALADEVTSLIALPDSYSTVLQATADRKWLHRYLILVI
jgi:hypothetical protein